MLNAVKLLAGGKVGVSILEQIPPCGRNDSRSGFSMATFYKPRITEPGQNAYEIKKYLSGA